MKTYDPTLKDAEITLTLPKAIVKDLALRAADNGNDIHLEIALRLSRSLERDLQMIEEDNDLALIAFEKEQQGHIS